MIDILLTDEPLIKYDKYFIDIMNRNGITTIKQVLLCDENAFLNKLNIRNRLRIRSIVGLLKYKYLNEDLITSPILNKNVKLDEEGNFMTIMENDFYLLGFTKEDINYFIKFNICYFFNDIYLNIPFIDYFKNFYDYKITNSKINLTETNILAKIKLYLDYIKDIEEQKEIGVLKDNLNQLLKKRDNLNQQILEVKQTLEPEKMGNAK